MVRTRFQGAFVSSCLALTGLTGCLLMEPINVPPEVALVVPQGPFFRGQRIAFEAVVANEKPASFVWNKAAGACDALPLAVSGEEAGSTFFVTPAAEELGDLCVRVQVKDSQGATRVAQAQVQVVDREPVVTLTQVQPPAGTKARLGSEVVVGAVASDPDPGDAPAFTLVLQTPDGKEVPFGACEDAARPKHEHCFVVTTPGAWVVAVKWNKDVTTSTLVSEPTTLEVMGDVDQPPCLAATPLAAQLIHDVRFPLQFEATVVDDLDSFPSTSPGRSKARFQWSVSDGKGGAFLALVDQTERVYALPDRYLPADELHVRLDVSDRVERTTTCKASDDVCGTATCLQRMTWTVSFR